MVGLKKTNQGAQTDIIEAFADSKGIVYIKADTESATEYTAQRLAAVIAKLYSCARRTQSKAMQ